MCVCVRFIVDLDNTRVALMCAAHHGNVLSCLLEFVFDATSDVSEVRQRELFKLDWPQNASVGLEHLQSLDNTHNQKAF